MIERADIIRSPRRTLSLEITADARLVVRAPARLGEAQITRVLREKAEWIEKKLAESRQRLLGRPKKHYASGEEFLFLGRAYPLTIAYASNRPLQLVVPDHKGEQHRFVLPGKDLGDPQAAFAKWYRLQAKSYLPKRVAEMASEFGFVYQAVRITGAQKRWGSCSSGKSLNFAWRLMLAPPEIIDYVIAHELAHLTHMNHSRAFWSEVTRICPDYKTQRKWLKDHGHLLEG